VSMRNVAAGVGASRRSSWSAAGNRNSPRLMLVFRVTHVSPFCTAYIEFVYALLLAWVGLLISHTRKVLDSRPATASPPGALDAISDRPNATR